MKRHTCIICKRKRNENFMKNVFLNTWACNDLDYTFYDVPICSSHPDIRKVKRILELKSELEVLTLKNFV